MRTGDILSLNLDNDDFMLISTSDYGYQNENRVLHIVKYNYDGEIDEIYPNPAKEIPLNAVRATPRCRPYSVWSIIFQTIVRYKE